MASIERPKYKPQKWNTPEAQGSHNCYDYAVDDDRRRPPGHKSQPGKAHGQNVAERDNNDARS
jgi:hypothetical protein